MIEYEEHHALLTGIEGHMVKPRWWEIVIFILFNPGTLIGWLAGYIVWLVVYG